MAQQDERAGGTATGEGDPDPHDRQPAGGGAAARALLAESNAMVAELGHTLLTAAVRYYEAFVALLGDDPAAGLDQFLAILEHARDWNDGAARKRLLAAFNTLDDAELVGRYRRRMASLLF